MDFKFKNLLYGLSDKNDGQMRLNDGVAIENRKKFFDKAGIKIEDVVSARLAHGNQIKTIDYNDKGKIIDNIDGLITNKRNLFLTITVADCLPIYFFDFQKEIIGIAHAGWKGILLNISGEMINKMKEIYKSDFKDIAVYIGPHIQKCHFEAKDDLIKKFDEYRDFIIKRNNLAFIDLVGIAKMQFEQAGIKSENITISNKCTYCENQKYFSFRRDKPEKVEAMAAYIGMK